MHIPSLLAAACAHVPIPEATDVVLSYYRTDNLLWLLEWGWTFLFPLLFLLTGVSAKLAALTKRWFWGILLYLFVFIVLYEILSFPLSFYAEYIVEHRYGLSTQTFGRWFTSYAMSGVILLLGALSVVWIFYLLLKKSPRRWWLYSALVLIALQFVMTFIQPIWIDPLFNTFSSMKDKKLEKKILDLAARAGIAGGRVFEVDKSRDTKKENAYVTGFGATKRIVFWDTTLKGESEAGLLFITGHEMGHYVLHHIWWSLLYISILALVLFYLVYKSAAYLVHRYRQIFGFARLDTIASFPLLLLLLSFYSFLSLPLTNALSRYHEHQADIFGLEMTHSNEAAGLVFTKLSRGNLANPSPGPLYKIWRSSHPPLAERIQFCNTYCPWQTTD